MSLVCFIFSRDGPRFVHPPIRSRALDRLCVGPRRRGGPRGGAGVRADTRAHFSWAYPSGWGPRIVATPCSAPGGTARPFPRVTAPFFPLPVSRFLPQFPLLASGDGGTGGGTRPLLGVEALPLPFPGLVDYRQGLLSGVVSGVTGCEDRAVPERGAGPASPRGPGRSARLGMRVLLFSVFRAERTIACLGVPGAEAPSRAVAREARVRSGCRAVWGRHWRPLEVSRLSA